MMKVLFIISLFVHFFSNQHVNCKSNDILDLRFKNIDICFEDHIVNTYYITPSIGGCSEPTSTYQIIKDIEIYPPADSIIQIDAIACRLIVETYENTKWWTFTKTSKLVNKRSFSVASDRCVRWVKQRTDINLGDLFRHPITPHTYVTINKKQNTFYWAQTIKEQVKNAQTLKTTLIFDRQTFKGSHFTTSDLKCDVLKGVCTSNTDTFLFAPFKNKCKTWKPYVGLSLLKYNLKNGNLYQVPELDLAFHKLIPCPAFIQKCISEVNKDREIRCTPTNFALTFKNITTLIDDNLKVRLNHYNNISARDNILSQAITSLAANTNSAIEKLAREFSSVLCKLGEISITNLRNTQYRKPSETLSLMLGRKVKATIIGEILAELTCTKVNATLVPTLRIGEEMSPRPLFRIHFANESNIAQYTAEGYLRMGLKGLTPQLNNQTTIFVIENSPIAFRNGSLLNKLPDINKLGLHPTSVLPNSINWNENILLSELTTVSDPNNLNAMNHILQSILGITSEHLIANGVDKNLLKKYLTVPMNKQEHLSIIREIKQFFRPKVPNFIKKIALFGSLTVTFLTALLITYIFCGFALKAIIKSSKNTKNTNNENQS